MCRNDALKGTGQSTLSKLVRASNSANVGYASRFRNTTKSNGGWSERRPSSRPRAYVSPPPILPGRTNKRSNPMRGRASFNPFTIRATTYRCCARVLAERTQSGLIIRSTFSLHGAYNCATARWNSRYPCTFEAAILVAPKINTAPAVHHRRHLPQGSSWSSVGMCFACVSGKMRIVKLRARTLVRLGLLSRRVA